MNTMKNDIATPRPWKLNGYLIESSLKTVMRAECDWHGRTPAFNAEQLANAELIIRAVNNFDALLDALNDAKDCLEALGGKTLMWPAYVKAERVIKNAEKQG